MEEIAARHGRRIFMSTAVALYNEQYPERALGVFDACAAARHAATSFTSRSHASRCRSTSRSRGLSVLQPPAFDPIKAYDREQLKSVFRDPSFRESSVPICATLSRARCSRATGSASIVAAPVKPENARLADRTIADIAREGGREPLDVLLDLGLEEDLDTGLIGRFFNAVDDGSSRWSNTKPASSRCRMPARHLVYLCDAGFGLYFLGHWVRDRAPSTSSRGAAPDQHQAGLYGIPIAAVSLSEPVPICCCSTPRRSASRRRAASAICRAAARARSAIQSGCMASL